MTKLNPLSTLVKDVYSKLDGNTKISQDRLDDLGRRLAKVIGETLSEGPRKPVLRMSKFGTNCDRRLWYDINTPSEAEPIEPWARYKFLYGHLLEELTLFLVEETGRNVTKRQHEVELHGVKGHIDAIVDGVLLDVKSANSRSFDKFKNHRLDYDDPFNYKSQLDLYSEALKDDPDLKVKGEYAFLAIDKELGHLVVDRYRKETRDWKRIIDDKRDMLGRPKPPDRGFEDKPDGKSGNRTLGTECKYCPYKHTCWPGLRTFMYSNGPRYLSRVVKEPEVQEIK